MHVTLLLHNVARGHQLLFGQPKTDFPTCQDSSPQNILDAIALPPPVYTARGWEVTLVLRGRRKAELWQHHQRVQLLVKSSQLLEHQGLPTAGKHISLLNE